MNSAHVIRHLKRPHIWGARRCAIATAHLLINVVAEHKPKDAEDLLQHVRSIGRRLVTAQPRELTIGNVVRRVLGLIREASEEQSKEESQQHLRQTNGTERTSSSKKPISSIKEDVLDGMRELLDELDQADKQIAEYATDQIHPEEVVLTYGASLTVQKFLLDASKRRKFTVIQVEAYPNEYQGVHSTLIKGAVRNAEDNAGGEFRLKSLSAAGLNVICIPDAAVFTVMSKVHKVLLPAQAILSNGGCVVTAGARMVAEAAKLHRIPVLTLGAIYRLSPSFPYDSGNLISLGDPGKALSYGDGELMQDVEIVNATQEYLSPELIDIIVTNMHVYPESLNTVRNADNDFSGGFAPSFMYRIAADHYRPQDVDL